MSEEPGQSGEKIHDPTPKKLEDARKKGNIARSQDMLTAMSYLGLWLTCVLFGLPLVQGVLSPLASIFAQAPLEGGGAHAVAAAQAALVRAAALVVLPVVLIAFVLVAQRGIVFTGSNLAAKLDRISLIKGAGRKFGANGLFEFAKSTTKLSVLCVALAVWLALELDRMVGLSGATGGALAAHMGDTIVALLGVATLVAGAMAALDMLWQRFEHQRKLRMSHQDLRDETKDSEGDPHQRAQRRRRAQELAGNRMLHDVPEADVVLVNPTAIAVALRWHRDRPGAPICVAKGSGEIAARIREIATTHGVPIHRDVPTARLIHRDVPVGAEISEETYRAVAAAIRFADRMRARMRAGAR